MGKKKIVSIGKLGASNHSLRNVDPSRAFEEMMRAYRDYQLVREQERTKRRDIEARERTALSEINARRELFMEYLTRSFDERRTTFSSLFDRVDDALKQRDTNALAAYTNAIIELAKSSPFRDLATIEATRRALKDPDHEWDI